MLNPSPPITVEQFEHYIARPENSDRLLELINGEIVEKMPSQLHGLIASLLAALLYAYRQSNPIFWVFTEVRVKLPNQNLDERIPDLSVALKAGRKIDPDAALPYMPELIIEIQSPNQSAKFMTDKADYYLSNDAKVVWIIYTSKRIIEVLTLDDRELLNPDDTLSGGELLPGFKVAVKDLFAAGQD